MKRITTLFVITLLSCVAAFAQAPDAQGAIDRSYVNIGRVSFPPVEMTGPGAHGPIGHPFHIEARHADGTKFYEYDGINMRTSAGTTWQAELMGKVTTPTTNAQCNYLALTNTAVTPAEADTTLSGEIATNGLGRAQAVFTNSSTTLATPAAPTLAVIGGAGGTAQFYSVSATNQGIDGSPSVASSSATPNATLDTTHYITVTFTGQNGASGYKVFRSNSGTTVSGSLAGGATQSSTGQISGIPSCSAALSCTVNDVSNTLTAYTVPGSNLTNFGKYTLVYTWTASGSQSAQAFGAFTAVSVGTMCFEGTFTQVALNTNDTFQLTETVFF